MERKNNQIYILERSGCQHRNQMREEPGCKLENQLGGYSKIVGAWTRAVRKEMKKGTVSQSVWAT